MTTTTKTPQRVQVFNHLKTHGYITDIIAQSYGIRRLASRIDELKKNGFIIIADIRRDDLGRRYAYYTFDKDATCNDIASCSYCDELAAIVPPKARLTA